LSFDAGSSAGFLDFAATFFDAGVLAFDTGVSDASELALEWRRPRLVEAAGEA